MLASALHTLAAAALLLALSPTVQAQNLWVVDAAGGPGSDFTNFPLALQSATDGDTLLVRSGDYLGPIVLDDLDLTIVADSGAVVEVERVEIVNLAATKSVTLRGLITEPQLFGQQSNLVVDDCEGRICIEDCRFEGASLIVGGVVRIDDTRAVTFTRCTLSPPSSGGGAATLSIRRSAVALFECSVVGADASPSVIGPGVASAAVLVDDARVTIAACELAGGDGGPGFIGANPCQNGGDGRPALEAIGTGLARVEIIDSTATGGVGGPASSGGCSAGADAPPFVVVAGQVSALPGVAPRFAMDSPLRSGELLEFELSGLPGSTTWMLLGFSPGLLKPYAPLLTGVAVVGAPELLLTYFPIPPDGTLGDEDLPGTLILPPGFTHLELYFQPVAFEPTFELIAASPTALLLLDPSF
ncbi:hypothetical protein Pla163_03720 [Planctomycetes bacterium Pla163]|uniref:Right handed beta helix domain-containing protein n=1 Tax=Rohdeia mirabilis TaxID=2528008 RepID=A0A518CVN9_9BACT|nr:hypothetical protein Pla163_03720 [Planctomycetes bacterium Pla163]